MKIQFYPHSPGGAEGEYAIVANGFATASLYWANESGILPDWSAIAHLSLSETGESRLYSRAKEQFHRKQRMCWPDVYPQMVF